MSLRGTAACLAVKQKKKKVQHRFFQIKENLKATMKVYQGERYRDHTDPEHCGSREQCSLPSTPWRDTDTGSGGTHNTDDT